MLCLLSWIDSHQAFLPFVHSSTHLPSFPCFHYCILTIRCVCTTSSQGGTQQRGNNRGAEAIRGWRSRADTVTDSTEQITHLTPFFIWFHICFLMHQMCLLIMLQFYIGCMHTICRTHWAKFSCILRYLYLFLFLMVIVCFNPFT